MRRDDEPPRDDDYPEDQTIDDARTDHGDYLAPHSTQVMRPNRELRQQPDQLLPVHYGYRGPSCGAPASEPTTRFPAATTCPQCKATPAYWKVYGP